MENSKQGGNWGIEVRLGTAATVENVKALDPAGVFIATGGTPIVPPIPGLNQDNVMTAEDVLLGKKTPTGTVAVIGGGMTGMETAETLAAKGNKVILIEMAKEIGRGLYKSVLVDFMLRFRKSDSAILTYSRLMGVNGNNLTIMNTMTSQISNIEADTVVLALGTKPDVKLTEEFEAAFGEVVVLGDANRPARIVEAAFDGLGRASTFLAD